MHRFEISWSVNTQLFTEIPSANASVRTKQKSCLSSYCALGQEALASTHRLALSPYLCLLGPHIRCAYLLSLCYCSLPVSHPFSFNVFFVLEMLGTESRILHMVGKHSTTEPYPKPFLLYFRIWQITPFFSLHFKICQHALGSQSPFPNIPHSVLILLHPEPAGLLQGASCLLSHLLFPEVKYLHVITGPQLSNLFPLSVWSFCVVI